METLKTGDDIYGHEAWGICSDIAKNVVVVIFDVTEMTLTQNMAFKFAAAILESAGEADLAKQVMEKAT